jgi:hypothetical protein
MDYLKLNIKSNLKRCYFKNILMFIETLSWGVTAAMSSLIMSIIFNLDIKTLRNVVIGSFILGCIRGYNQKII